VLYILSSNTPGEPGLHGRVQRQESLTKEAYQKIKGFVLRREIYLRQKITIKDLAKRMGISRTPIREAMSRLVKKGYVNDSLGISKTTIS
jgi:DNA-binding GntR family transcriptional regulator